MKNQALFCSKQKSKKVKCHLLQFLFAALRVKWLFCNIKRIPNKFSTVKIRNTFSGYNLYLNFNHWLLKKMKKLKKKKRRRKLNLYPRHSDIHVQPHPFFHALTTDQAVLILKAPKNRWTKYMLAKLKTKCHSFQANVENNSETWGQMVWLHRAPDKRGYW